LLILFWLSSASELRPLNLKNGDNKAIASVTNHLTSDHLDDWAHSSQRGFIRGRNFLLNVLEADTFSRLAALEGGSFSSFLIWFDFLAAFHSLHHDYLMACLKMCNFPQGFINYIKSLYQRNDVFTISNGKLKYLFPILRGVLQGCPMSATLFVIAIDPLLRFICDGCTEQMKCFACADDICCIEIKFLL